MLQPHFQIGDNVWLATTETVERFGQCPCCYGNCYVTLITGDGVHNKIACEECSTKGYDNYSSGTKKYYEHVFCVKSVTINRVEVYNDKVEYGTTESYCVEEENLFLLKEEADARCIVLAEERNKQEINKLHSKHDHSKSWAWNVSYYRKKIKEAYRDIERFTEKLNAAPKKKGVKLMSLIQCDNCEVIFDTDEFDFTEQHGKIYCEACLEHLKNAF